MSSERPLIVSEGNWLDDADRMLMSKQVDFREPRDRYSVSTLVKLGESQLAPRRLRTIRISKPEFFRRGRDPNETRAQQSTEHVDDIDEPEGLAQLRAAEVNRAAELVDSRIRVTADGMRVRQTRRRKTTNTISLRNHGWIYCTAIEPTSDEEWRDLKAMMPAEYDHASYIYRPRAFALALVSMLADQFGIRDLHAVKSGWTLGSQTSMRAVDAEARPSSTVQLYTSRTGSPDSRAHGMSLRLFWGRSSSRISASKPSGNIDSLSGRRMNRPKITWISGYRWQCGRPCCR